MLAGSDVEHHAVSFHGRRGHDTIGEHPGVRPCPGKRDPRGASGREPQAHSELLGIPCPLDAHQPLRLAPDGGWDEEAFTGTGFPRAFYLRYHMYPVYFPLMALSRYRKVLRARRCENEQQSN